MADNRLHKDYYLEKNFRGQRDKCIKSPLPIALDVTGHAKRRHTNHDKDEK